MLKEADFRFLGFKESVAQSRNEASRSQLSRLERGFCAASDFDTDCAMEGYVHPFVYRAAQIPEAIWFWEFIGASATAQPVTETLLALQSALGEPGPDDYGDAVFEIAASSPDWEARFTGWDELYSIHSDWAGSFDEFLRGRGIDPHEFWQG
ncbi:hypothetical protein [Deinococcus yunweiensis]|uniref:hypothetical protein n=1 Tax=Deinococcus yunweiensis TaxID=367282 RepID=UPI00398E8153